MSSKRSVEPAVAVEAAAHFKHDGLDRRPGDVVEMNTRDAADLIALGFARPVVDAGYARRDMKAKA